ncbi:MAG TPA: DUF4190 domain-containing protein [Pseudonocardiaceae bacterium]|jgi:hypothetical protein|nr:DUF4190 domain-containing protein [Pseudonocardiaceae bacterium]
MTAPQPYGQQPPYPQQNPYQQAAPQPGNGIAIGGMVTGIVGLVFGWVPVVGFVLGAIALILSGVGIHNANTKNASGRGMAVAGLVCGILAVVFGIFWIVVFGAAGAAAGVS